MSAFLFLLDLFSFCVLYMCGFECLYSVFLRQGPSLNCSSVPLGDWPLGPGVLPVSDTLGLVPQTHTWVFAWMLGV